MFSEASVSLLSTRGSASREEGVCIHGVERRLHLGEEGGSIQGGWADPHSSDI